MTMLLEVKDQKANFILELLKSFPYLKITPYKRSKEHLIQQIQEAVEEVKLIKSGKLKSRPVKDLLDEI